MAGCCIGGGELRIRCRLLIVILETVQRNDGKKEDDKQSLEEAGWAELAEELKGRYLVVQCLT